VGLARELKADDRTVQDAFYLPLLAMAGCTAESHASASMMGDEVAVGTESYGLDWGESSREQVIMHGGSPRRAQCSPPGAAGRSRGFRRDGARQWGRNARFGVVARKRLSRPMGEMRR